MLYYHQLIDYSHLDDR